MVAISIFAISDLHLSTNTDKSMEVFGDKWSGYMQKISENWKRLVSEDDTVIIGGDVSWEMKLADSISDFEFINRLPGKKIISKGNHDYWWETASKLKAFIVGNNFSNIEFIYNNAYSVQGVAICGTRWWNDPSSEGFGADDLKIYNHEILRLETSLKAASELGCEKIIAVLHYPPFNTAGNVNEDIKKLFEEHRVNECVYGHLHGLGLKNAVEGQFHTTNYRLTSADFLDFCPIRIKI